MLSGLFIFLAGVVVGSFLPFVKTASVAVYNWVKAKFNKDDDGLNSGM